MIDYEKLKLAHELAEKCGLYTGITAYAYFKSVDHLDNEYKYRLYLDDCDIYIDETYSNIDDLISRLKELVEPEVKQEAKYKVGDEVWFMAYEEAMRDVTIKVEKDEDGFWYRLQNGFARERALYPTKSALIESRIEYWRKLQDEEIKDAIGKTMLCQKECGHEGKIAYMHGPKNTTMKCIKCGEFYR